MELIRQWLLGVVSCAFLVSLADQLAPEGAPRGIVRFCGGLVLILCMLRPLGGTELSELAPDVGGLAEGRAALAERYEADNNRALAGVIEERTGAYIEDKARELGLSVTAEVEAREEGGAILPDRVTLFGTENEALTALIESELGVGRERQEWRAAE